MILDEYLDRLRDATPVRYYASGVDGARVYWPWRMLKAKAEADRRHGEASDHYVIDSNFNDESVTNEHVLDEAVEYNADVAVLADVYHDADATVDALLEGVERADDHAFDGTLLLPLQAPHADSYLALRDSVPEDVWWGVGGQKDTPALAKIQAARELRDVAPGEWIHGFGFGITPELADTIRSNPSLLDSIDSSTAMQNTDMGEISGESLDGELNEKMSVAAARANANRVELLRELTDFVETDRPTEQSTLVQSVTAADGGDTDFA